MPSADSVTCRGIVVNQQLGLQAIVDDLFKHQRQRVEATYMPVKSIQ